MYAEAGFAGQTAIYACFMLHYATAAKILHLVVDCRLMCISACIYMDNMDYYLMAF